MPHPWVVVVPVKELRLAKTRLAALDPVLRADLALAMARDVVAAARACPAVSAVFVVTNDLAAAATLDGDGALVVADTADSGLNPALAETARVAAGWHPRSGIAALSSDLPCLAPGELAAALGAAGAANRCFVTDGAGTGTTMLTAAPGVLLAPAFGRESRERHRQSGALELAGEWPGLRCDVDTAADLERAARGPLGACTSEVLARVRPAG